MNLMPFNRRNLSFVAVGIAGWLSGTIMEKYKSSQLNETDFKGLQKTPVFKKDVSPTHYNTNEPGGRFLEVQTRTSEIMKYGFPGLDHIMSFDDFVLSYDRKNKVPHWVFEHLTKERLEKSNVDRTLCDFKEDMSIHEYFRSRNDDYKGSGYDRGHLAAAGNHKMAQSHCDQTFFLTNIAPQQGKGFNRDSWNRLEKYVRKLARQNRNVYVCTGPLYVASLERDGKMYMKYRVLGRSQVAVPTHFFKVVVVEDNKGDFGLEAYVMPNESIEGKPHLDTFLTPLEGIERQSGFLFFDGLSREKFVSINKVRRTRRFA